MGNVHKTVFDRWI